MDPHQKLKQEYLRTQRAAQAAWVEEQARHSDNITTKPSQVTPANLYNHKDPDKTTSNLSSNTQGMNESRANSSLPAENITTPVVVSQATSWNKFEDFFTKIYWKESG